MLSFRRRKHASTRNYNVNKYEYYDKHVSPALHLLLDVFRELLLLVFYTVCNYCVTLLQRISCNVVSFPYCFLSSFVSELDSKPNVRKSHGHRRILAGNHRRHIKRSLVKVAILFRSRLVLFYFIFFSMTFPYTFLTTFVLKNWRFHISVLCILVYAYNHIQPDFVIFVNPF